MSHTQEHQKLKEDFSKLGKKFCFYCSEPLYLFLDVIAILFSSSDEELKSVREKNRQHETSQERLSSDKVRWRRNRTQNSEGLSLSLVF